LQGTGNFLNNLFQFKRINFSTCPKLLRSFYQISGIIVLQPSLPQESFEARLFLLYLI
jgi:hypothetical protein